MQTAVVTGGGSGIGLATATELSAQGARVYVGDVKFSDARRQQLTTAGIVAVECDVRVADDVRRLVSAAIEGTGRLDVL